MENKTAAVVTEILGRLGIEAVESYDTVSSAIDAELLQRGFTAKVSGIRWGCVTVVSDRRELPQLNWMKDILENVARRSSKGAVTSVRIRGSDNVRVDPKTTNPTEQDSGNIDREQP